jgi:hypothetical protein
VAIRELQNDALEFVLQQECGDAGQVEAAYPAFRTSSISLSVCAHSEEKGEEEEEEEEGKLVSMIGEHNSNNNYTKRTRHEKIGNKDKKGNLCVRDRWCRWESTLVLNEKI